MSDTAIKPQPLAVPHVRAIWIIASVLALLSLISLSASWYGEHVLLQRYCAAPADTVRLLGEILQEDSVTAGIPRTRYVVSARIAYLIPQMPDEGIESYLRRVTAYFNAHCR